MATIQLPYNWRPRDYQQPVWQYLESGGKRAECIWHRRSGKDEVGLHRMAVAAFERPATYWYLLPMQTQGRKAIWEAVNPHTGKRRIDEAFPQALRETTRENEMAIRFRNGAMFHVVGSDNYDALVGSPPAGVVFSEWALADPASWGFLRPILAENNGWALFITTPRGNNHAKTMLDRASGQSDWFTEILPATRTNVFTEDQLAIEKADYIAQFGKDQGTALYEQEYLCSFEAAILGSYYGHEIAEATAEDRIGNVPVERGKLVMTGWDLGFTDATAIWFIQVVGRELHLIDYEEGNNQGLDYYVKVLRDRGYLYGDHHFPHDVQAHELSTGKSRVATLRSLGLKPHVVPVHQINDGVNAVRQLFPRMWIDATRCARGLEALRNYRREWDSVAKTFKAKPSHDWTSHGADALRTFAAGFKDSPLAAKRRDPYKDEDDKERYSGWAV